MTDLKPTNLFLVGKQTDQVKILDFGVARRFGTPQALTRIGMLVGTAEYMAPEPARGNPELTPAADLFSLGCVLYECLTGTPPFSAEHLTTVLARILFEEPLPLEQARPGVPEPLLRILKRLLAKDPAQRWADAAALRAELAVVVELAAPGLAAPESGPAVRAPQSAFAAHEQNLFSVVLAALPTDGGVQVATLPESGELLAEAQRPTLVQALLALGTQPDFLADGSLVVTIPPKDSAQDQVVLAAHAALRIKAYRPQAVVTLVTGRGIIQGYTAVGEVVEQAARMLKNSGAPAAGREPSGVLVDPLSAKLLEGRFVLMPQEGRVLLMEEEREADTSRPLLGNPTPCVGRESELAMLASQLAGTAEDSEARAVLITAPPGTAKSRLRHEFLRRVTAQSKLPVVLLGRGDMMSSGAPYHLVAKVPKPVPSVSCFRKSSDLCNEV